MVMRTGEALTCTVDHLIPRSQGGVRYMQNLVGACWQCNNARGDMPYQEFKKVWREMLVNRWPIPNKVFHSPDLMIALERDRLAFSVTV